MLEDLGLKVTVRLKVKKGVPFGLGLGSSGASASAAVSAVNELLGLGLRREDLVKYAMLGEGAVSGSPHPDNVAASLFGGVVAVVSTSPIRVAQIPVRVAFNLLLIIPRVKPMEGKTRKARELVPNRVNLSDAVQNARFISSLILGLESGNRELIRLGLNDEIVEKARTPMYPHYPEVKKVALESDAIGVCVSGAGPSVLVFYDKYTDIMGLKDRADNVCKKNGFACDFIETELAGGVRLRESTKSVRESIDPTTGAITTPIYQTTAFLYPEGERYRYSREINPTVLELAKKIAELEGAEAGLAFSSGMGAISTSLLTLSRPGSKILVHVDMFGRSVRFVKDYLSSWGVKVNVAPADNESMIEMAKDKHDIVLWKA
jgi:homoserine kinase (EC 2.7.1.39)